MYSFRFLRECFAVSSPIRITRHPVFTDSAVLRVQRSREEIVTFAPKVGTSDMILFPAHSHVVPFNILSFLTWSPGVTPWWSEWSPMCSVPYLQAPCSSLGYHGASQMRHRVPTLKERKLISMSNITVHWRICHDTRRCLSLAYLQSTDFMAYAPHFFKSLQK